MRLLHWKVLAVWTIVLSVWSVGLGQGPESPLPQPPGPQMQWKERIELPGDPFLVYGAGQNEPAWVKFTIVLASDDAPRVYFQDGHEYALHYEFAIEHLAPFAGMTPEQFDEATLYRQGRKAVLGAVVTPALGMGWSQPAEYGIQLVGREPFTREEVLAWVGLIETHILTDEEHAAFYFPSYEQRAAAEADRAWLEANGLSIGSTDRWAHGNTCYAPGWAVGRLTYVEGNAISQAYRDGVLEPDDILLTDGVPAEIPFVGGIITLAPSTPNSHVAILAKTYNVPFVHLAVPADANQALELVDRNICLRASETNWDTSIRLIDLQDVLDEATIQEIRALKQPPPLQIAPISPYGSYAMSTEALMPADIGYFGGKAANFGILRRAIPDHAPVALGLSFDLWTDFLAQELADGRTLGRRIAERLAAFAYPPADMAALSAALEEIRDLIEDDTTLDFTDAQKQKVLAALQDPLYGFDPLSKLRFRSSTNVEDGETFTGAGLYDSYSGCLADDLDDDTRGPCLCDPDRANERGVFTVIRKVFASFYNDNAYLERLRHGVDANEVGMALLVHHSFPDEIELANGVATVTCEGDRWEITLVTQDGATSVTNPQDGSIPEEVRVQVYSFGTYAWRVRQSNLVPLGAAVMAWDKDYTDLADLLVKVGAEFAAATGREQYVLEMEYKKIAPEGRLVVKQVRPIPQPDETPSIVPFLVNEPTEYCLFQGEFGDIFANHRLKSRWQLQTENLWLTDENLRAGMYGSVAVEYTAGGAVRQLSGRMAKWPEAAHRYGDGVVTDAWRIADLDNPRRYALQTTNIPTLVSAAQSAVVTLRDFGRPVLEVEYAEPVLQWDWDGPTQTRHDQAMLWPSPAPSADDSLQKRRFETGKGVVIETSFYWPPMPKGPVAGYTHPLARWVETRIEGYTGAPIVLRGYFSQTYRPGHHNFSEHFLFEPQLEPDLPAEVRAELSDKDIRLIHVFGGMGEVEIATYGFSAAL